MDDPPPESSASSAATEMTTARSTNESSKDESPPSPKPTAPPLSPASSTSTVAQEAPGDLQAAQGVNTPQQQHEQRHSSDDVRCCYGMRAYDGGYYDVGIFFVFHDSSYGDEAGDTTAKTRDRGAGASAPKFDAGGDAPSEVDTAQGAAANDNSNLNPFGYRFVDGLKVIAAVGEKEEQVVSGQESGIAMQAYVQLEKQAAAIRRAVEIADRDAKLDPMEEDGAEKVSGVDDGKGTQDQFLALGNTEDNDSVQGLVRSDGCTWLGTFSLPPAPEGQEEETFVDLWPKRILRFADFGEYGVLALDGDADAQGSLKVAASAAPSVDDPSSGKGSAEEGEEGESPDKKRRRKPSDDDDNKEDKADKDNDAKDDRSISKRGSNKGDGGEDDDEDVDADADADDGDRSTRNKSNGARREKEEESSSSSSTRSQKKKSSGNRWEKEKSSERSSRKDTTAKSGERCEGSGQLEPAETSARRTYALISRALSDVRALIPNLPAPSSSPAAAASSSSRSPSPVLGPEESSAAENPSNGSSGVTVANGNRPSMHPHSNGGGNVSDDDSREQRQNRMLGGGKRVAAQISQSSQKSSEGGPGPADRERFEDGGGGAAAAAAAAAEGGGRGVPERQEDSEYMMENASNGYGNSRKRPRTGEDDRRFASVKPDPEQLVENGNMGRMEDGSMVPRVLGGGGSRAMYRGAEPLPRPPRPLPIPPPGVALGSNGMDNDDGAAGAGEMTVVAVRTSLLRNRADEGPIPDEGEWEMMVRKFIRYVEGLEPGPTQEELSLMFAAALDPTLVRMRAANNALIELAELCALPDPGLSAQDDEEDDGDDDYGGPGGPGPFPRQGFKVRLELDAEEPPPEGVQFLLKTVSAARGTVEAAARARACVTAAGDTLGGLHELKADYKRSLPPGPREPIQSIIEEEQARVRGYATAHEDIEAHRLHELRLRGRDVGEAYRRVEGEPGWSDVKRQVDAFLRRFAAYCAARLPEEGSDPGLLGPIPLGTARMGGGGGPLRM